MARGARNRFRITLADGILYHEDEAYVALIASMFTWPEGSEGKSGRVGNRTEKSQQTRIGFLLVSILQIHMS